MLRLVTHQPASRGHVVPETTTKRRSEPLDPNSGRWDCHDSKRDQPKQPPSLLASRKHVEDVVDSTNRYKQEREM
jgi:hypothetical protein